MPEEAVGTNESTTDGNQTSGTTSTAGDTFTAITSQADLDKAIGPRLERERAKFAGFDDLKAKAAKFDELAEANKSEIEKANEKAATAQAELDKVPAKVADALRTYLVGLHKDVIDDDKASLFLTASDPELLLKQVQALVGTEADRKKNGNRAPREGQTPDTSGTGGEREFVRGLFRKPE